MILDLELKKTKSLRLILAPLLRFITSLGVTFCVSTGVMYLSYVNYWGATIFRIQSVDFNMLSAILPSTISPLLERNNYELIQSIIDSNYGLFGIVVTKCNSYNCSQEEIVAMPRVKIIISDNKKKFISNSAYSGWLKELTKDPDHPESRLKGELFSNLKSPPPINQEWTFKSPRMPKPESTGFINKGKLIGKIYFLRNPPPSFEEDLGNWISKVFKIDSWSWLWDKSKIAQSGSASVLYTGIAIAAFLAAIIVWILMEIIISKQSKITKVKQQELEERLKNAELLRRELEQLKIIEFTERDLNNFKQYFKAIRGVINEDFVSTVNTSTQIMQSILTSIQGIIHDIIHDLNKAPLLNNHSEIQEIKDITSEIPDHIIQKKIIQKQEKLLINLQDTVETITWSMRGISRLVEDKVNFDLISEIKEFKNNLPPKIRSQCEIIFEFCDQPLYIYGNPEQVRSIIKNAIYNSCAAVIKAKVDNPHIDVKIELEDSNVSVIIEDNGKGIPSGIISKLYESEVRISSDPMGGFGNMIATSFLKLNGGSVYKKNKPRHCQGAIIRFTFPLITTDSPLV